MSSRTPHAWHLTAKPALVPFRSIVSHKRKLRRKHPPFALERQIPALHILKSDVFPFCNLTDMLSQATA